MAEIIQSTQNPLVKRARQLASDPGARRASGLVLVEGTKLVLEALKGRARVRQAIIGPGCAIRAELQRCGAEILEFGAKAFASVSDTENPQGALLFVERPALELPPPGRIRLAVAVEALQDPGNLGTVLRSAWACGADAVILSEGCADAYAPKAVRAAAAAQLHLAIEDRVPLAQRLAQWSAAGLRMVALEPEARNSLWDADLRGQVCFVVGSEGQGLSAAVSQACGPGFRLDYPGQTESINAAVCLSVALFEALRQRRK
jgi:TrmH family RNA methyltransferase